MVEETLPISLTCLIIKYIYIYIYIIDGVFSIDIGLELAGITGPFTGLD